MRRPVTVGWTDKPPTNEQPARQRLAARVGIGIGIGIGIENSKRKNQVRSRSRLRSRYRGGNPSATSRPDTPPTDEEPARQPLAARVGIGIGIGIGIENSRGRTGFDPDPDCDPDTEGAKPSTTSRPPPPPHRWPRRRSCPSSSLHQQPCRRHRDHPKVPA
jgi:hypothetical protein